MSTPQRDEADLEQKRAEFELELWVMATINLPGLSQGEYALVDPRVPYIATALEARYLVPVDSPYGGDDAHR